MHFAVERFIRKKESKLEENINDEMNNPEEATCFFCYANPAEDEMGFPYGSTYASAPACESCLQFMEENPDKMVPLSLLLSAREAVYKAGGDQSVIYEIIQQSDSPQEAMEKILELSSGKGDKSVSRMGAAPEIDNSEIEDMLGLEPGSLAGTNAIHVGGAQGVPLETLMNLLQNPVKPEKALNMTDKNIAAIDSSKLEHTDVYKAAETLAGGKKLVKAPSLTPEAAVPPSLLEASCTHCGNTCEHYFKGIEGCIRCKIEFAEAVQIYAKAVAEQEQKELKNRDSDRLQETIRFLQEEQRRAAERGDFARAQSLKERRLTLEESLKAS